MQQEVRFCTTADNVRIAYAVTGNGPPLLMPASWLSHLEHQWQSLVWKPWLETLSQKHTLIRYDSRGCGLSDRDGAALSFDGWMQDVEAVADAAGFEQFDMLAVCWGSPIAINYASLHPERVRRLVLFGGYARGQLRNTKPLSEEDARIMLDMTRIGWGKVGHAFSRMWGNVFQPSGTLAHYRSWAEQQAHATTPETAARLLEIGWQVDVRDSAGNVRCPTLAIHVTRDSVIPIEVGRELATLISGCRFVQLESDNHMPLVTEPAWPKIVALLDEFLAPGSEESQAPTSMPIENLTTRERDVLEAIARGLDNTEIATALGMSEKTVRNHVTRVLDKIGAQHRYQAIVRAREAGFGIQKEATTP